MDHGIESSEHRLAEGKPAVGVFAPVGAKPRARLFAAIEDDGRGVDWDAVRRICEERRLPLCSRTDLVNVLISAGFSTRTEVTDISGRGIGLAAAASLIRDLGGELAVDSERSTGTRWTLTFTRSSTESVAPMRAGPRLIYRYRLQIGPSVRLRAVQVSEAVFARQVGRRYRPLVGARALGVHRQRGDGAAHVAVVSDAANPGGATGSFFLRGSVRRARCEEL